MEARVAPRDRKSKPLATVITADMLPQPLKGRTDAASGIGRPTPIADGRGASAEGAIQGGAEASPDGASAGQDTQETPTPDARRVGQPVSSTADAPAGTVAQPSTLEPTPVKLKQVKAAQYDRANPNDTASYVVEGNPDVSVEKLGANWAAVNTKTKERVATAPNLKELRTKLASKMAPVKAAVTPTTKQVTQEATPTPGAAKATSPSVKQTTQKAKPTPGTAKSKPEGKPVATKTTPKTNADRVVEAVAEYRKIKSPTGNQAAAFVSQLKVLGIANPPAFLANLQKMKETVKATCRPNTRVPCRY
jgi:hypothetical protein